MQDPAFPSPADQRRSTRVPVRVSISALPGTGAAWEGETIVVNLHGALVRTTAALTFGEAIELEVHLTGKKARAKIAWCGPAHSSMYGIALEQPENIWGIPLPPSNWNEDDDLQRDRR